MAVGVCGWRGLQGMRVGRNVKYVMSSVLEFCNVEFERCSGPDDTTGVFQ